MSENQLNIEPNKAIRKKDEVTPSSELIRDTAEYLKSQGIQPHQQGILLTGLKNEFAKSNRKRTGKKQARVSQDEINQLLECYLEGATTAKGAARLVKGDEWAESVVRLEVKGKVKEKLKFALLASLELGYDALKRIHEYDPKLLHTRVLRQKTVSAVLEEIRYMDELLRDLADAKERAEKAEALLKKYTGQKGIWHDIARDMKAEGKNNTEIAKAIGVNRVSVSRFFSREKDNPTSR